MPHLLENSKNDDLLYRGIDLHDNTTFTTNTNKSVFMTNANDTVSVKVPIYSKDISDYFRQLDFPLKFAEYNISLRIVDEIYYNAADMGTITQTIKSAHLSTDVCYLDEKNNIEYIENLNEFNKTIPIFDNHVKINDNKIKGSHFTINANNVTNCKNVYLMLIKDNAIIKIPNKSCLTIQMKVNSQKFQNAIENNTDAVIIFKNRSPYTNEFILNYNQFLNNYLIYCFPLDPMLKYDSGNKYVEITGDPDDDSASTAIVVFQQNTYINLKIENKSLIVTKTYKIYL